MNSRLPASEGSKPAVWHGDYILTTHPVSATHNALSDQFRVLHERSDCIDDSRNQNLALWKLHTLPDPASVPATGIRPSSD